MEGQSLPKIYSKKAILVFSVFFSTIFGGVLLYQNLRNLQKKKEANIVLLSSILFTIIFIFLVNIPENPRSSLAYLGGFVGGGFLSYYFVPKYISDEENYPKKTIWKPLIIGLVITIVYVLTLAVIPVLSRL